MVSEIPKSPAAPTYRDSELVFGLVAPVGTKLDTFENVLERNLKRYGYGLNKVRLSQLAENFLVPDQAQPPADETEYQRLSRLMTLGNELRKRHSEFLASAAAAHIHSTRVQESPTIPRTVHVVRSLKHPDEVLALRRIYGAGFFLIGVNVEEAERRRYLHNEKNCSEEELQLLLKRDDHEDGEPHGQRTRETFHLADVFLPLEDEPSLSRFLDLVFGYPFSTPELDEYAMFLAFTSSLRSADLSRQVGAVIVSEQGDIVGVGANDVPRFGGGLYWPGPKDQRDHVRGEDFNERERERIVKQVLDALRPQGYSEPEWSTRGKERLAGVSVEHSALDTILERLRPEEFDADSWQEEGRRRVLATPLADITEYGRAVHAEMEAILSCARSGVSPRSGTLYSTTFPCHNCAKHLVAAGVKRVVYVEPYAKSKALDLFSDSISLRKEADRVSFEAFQGIGPRRFLDLFSLTLGSGYKTSRKERGGKKVGWDASVAFPRVPMLPNTYIERERVAAEELLALTEVEDEKNHS